MCRHRHLCMYVIYIYFIGTYNINISWFSLSNEVFYGFEATNSFRQFIYASRYLISEPTKELLTPCWSPNHRHKNICLWSKYNSLWESLRLLAEKFPILLNRNKVHSLLGLFSLRALDRLPDLTFRPPSKDGQGWAIAKHFYFYIQVVNCSITNKLHRVWSTDAQYYIFENKQYIGFQRRNDLIPFWRSFQRLIC